MSYVFPVNANTHKQKAGKEKQEKERKTERNTNILTATHKHIYTLYVYIYDIIYRNTGSSVFLIFLCFRLIIHFKELINFSTRFITF